MGRRIYPLLIFLAGLNGCVISPLRNGTTTPTGTSTGQLYVSTAGSILRYSNALAANGNVAPDVTTSGAGTQLNSPNRIFLDINGNRLFVANKASSSVLVFSPASTSAAGSTPTAVLTSTGNMVSPVDVTVDPGANLLYVADGQNILVFTGESSLSGNVNTPPVRTINFTFNIGAIFLDAPNNTMFIADTADNAVDIMQSASTASGSGTLLINGVISGSPTNLSAPNGIALDSTGRVIVSNGGASPSILVFSNLVVPSGGQATPVATISGSATNVKLPGQMVFNGGANNGELYVADSQAPGILVFTNVNSASGTISSAPTRSIIGSGTQLNANAVNGVALDTTR